MNRLRIRRAATALAAAVVLPLALAACSGPDSGKDTNAASTPASDEAAQADKAPATDAMAPGTPFGPACAGVPKEGAGSFDGMAKDPVATAASNNPALSTLVAAVKRAGLVDTLNKAEGITVFAPTNDAFAKIPKGDLDKVLADKKTLTDILTYHVVGRNLTPEQLQNGSFETLQKGIVTTSGSGRAYKVNDTAKVVCGNVSTSNATVYIVDTVLMPG
ncbi:fasciclin domain-containing protein [Streptomyces clavuligerus]|nr:fasciclin domain-containing protein [Streptomyces clavuligerus]EDY47371.1 lipoprotein [Streptomyces clavuligerus]MBY6306561.1 fasciclin domain-containing protein [Streptomyces clavuligerus]QCS10988.1 fasciclin domain-containing protein [Streptomyces clavuligerus]QPJ97129.1 fasciclin domain-containing protein [Streptomyces clavuligerus]WDN57538.1 fasciclin domain-containing protein [Streptomyces clavuligerus]